MFEGSRRAPVLGTAAPVVLVHQAIPQVASEQQTENKSAANVVYKIYGEMNRDTNFEYTSSSEVEF